MSPNDWRTLSTKFYFSRTRQNVPRRETLLWSRRTREVSAHGLSINSFALNCGLPQSLRKRLRSLKRTRLAMRHAWMN